MHVNYEYLLNFIRANYQAHAKSLDYGCGGGEIVSAGLQECLEISGVEAFYEGGSTKTNIEELGLLNSSVKELKDDHIDFPDSYFDLIVNNQVLEHVEDLALVLSEMSRVLIPGGKVLCLFPSKEVWREGHCGIPFLHWFPKNSRARIYYAYILRTFGMGYHKKDKTKMEWVRSFCNWLDNYKYYRTKPEIVDTFQKSSMNITFCEYDYVLFRLKHNNSKLYPFFRRMAKVDLFVWVIRKLMHKLVGMVFIAEKYHCKRAENSNPPRFSS